MPTGGWHPAFLLPGLWLAALTVALAWGLRRWLDPVPARCWAVWWIAILALFWRSLLGGAVLLPLGILTRWAPFRGLWPSSGLPESAPRPGNPLQVDLVLQIHPWLAQARRALLAGEWPLWNELAGAGEPLLGNPQSQSLQPIALAALPLELAQAPAAMAALRVLLACAFTYLLLRRQAIGEGPALAASLCWGLGGGVQLWLGWPIANTVCLLPAVLYALVASEERGGRAAHLLLAAALFALLVGGHPETILHALLLVSAFAVSRLRRRGPHARRAVLAGWAAAAAVAVASAAPALLPAVAVLRDSQRAEQVERARARRAGATATNAAGRSARREQSGEPSAGPAPARRGAARAAALRLSPVAAPPAFGNSRYGAYWGHRNSNLDGSAFAGSAALLAALAALGPRRRRLPQERLMLGVAALALVVAARPPGLDRLLSAIPLLRESPQLHYRVLLLLGFAVTYLAACTWERWRRDGLSPRHALAGGALVAAAVGALYLLFAPPVPGTLAGWRGLAFAAQVAGLAAAAALAALGGWGRRAAAGAFLALAGVELLLLHGPANPPSPRGLHYPETPALRLAAARLASGERLAATDGALRPNAASPLGLADARSNNPAGPAAVARALAAARRRAGPRELFVAPLHPLHDLMAVRLVLTAPGESLPRPLRRIHAGTDAWVYERPRWLVALFLPESTTSCGDAGWSRCLEGIRDFAARAVVRPAAAGALAGVPGPGRRWRAARPADSALRLLSHEPTHVSAALRLAEPRLVASSIHQDGGWRALVDRRPRPGIAANGPFAAVVVRPPATRLDLVYRPPGFLGAALLGALGLAAGLTLAAPPPRRRPRSEASPAVAISSRP